MSTFEAERIGPLWIARPHTRYGQVELLCGEGEHADAKALRLAEKFLEDSADYLGAVRRSAFALPKLWQPIRLAINDEGRLGVQFRNRLTGQRAGMFFADEHSHFRERL
jgi:hypothetical protein